jgi:type VI secretion system protein ImpJ
MFLQPQHFQQQERHWQSWVEGRCAGGAPYQWGFLALSLDESQLALGKVALAACQGVMPDGTPFLLPANDALPAPLDIPDGTHDARVVLAVALRRQGVPVTDWMAASDVRNGAAWSQEDHFRYGVIEETVADDNGGIGEAAITLQTGRLQLQLMFEHQAVGLYTAIGVMHVLEKGSDRRVLLDMDYVPPCLDVQPSRPLREMIRHIVGLLHQRATALADRLLQPGGNGVAEIADFLLLQLLNRSEPVFVHLAALTIVHPEHFYRMLIQLVGELATFTRADKRPAAIPPYLHDDLARTFLPLMAQLRQSLSTVSDPHAIAIPLQERRFGLRVGVVVDGTLFGSARFVLAVAAHLPAETMLHSFPAQAKIGAIEKIRDLVNLQLTGIALRVLPVAPRELPFHAGHAYFALEIGDEEATALRQSSGLAIHVGGDFPGLSMQLWAIRQ